MKDYPGNTPPRNRPDSPPPPKAAPDPHKPKGKPYIIGGQTVTMYTIGEVSKCMGRRPVTIRSWEAKGWMPLPLYRTPTPVGADTGRRLYTETQLDLLMRAAAMFKVDEPRPEWAKFRKFLNDNWALLPTK